MEEAEANLRASVDRRTNFRDDLAVLRMDIHKFKQVWPRTEWRFNEVFLEGLARERVLVEENALEKYSHSDRLETLDKQKCRLLHHQEKYRQIEEAAGVFTWASSESFLRSERLLTDITSLISFKDIELVDVFRLAIRNNRNRGGRSRGGGGAPAHTYMGHKDRSKWIATQTARNEVRREWLAADSRVSYRRAMAEGIFQNRALVIKNIKMIEGLVLVEKAVHISNDPTVNPRAQERDLKLCLAIPGIKRAMGRNWLRDAQHIMTYVTMDRLLLKDLIANGSHTQMLSLLERTDLKALAEIVQGDSLVGGDYGGRT